VIKQRGQDQSCACPHLLFPRFFTRPPGNLDSQPPPRSDHVEACRPQGYVASHFSVTRGLRSALRGYVIPVPRCNQPRWSLGALALVALSMAGCGAAAERSRASLHPAAERQLLSLVARARADASDHNGRAVRTVLGEFVSDVRTLRSSGQLSRTTATNLDRVARVTEAQAAKQLPTTTSIQPSGASAAPSPPGAASKSTASPTNGQGRGTCSKKGDGDDGWAHDQRWSEDRHSHGNGHLGLRGVTCADDGATNSGDGNGDGND
jgi:hypothetical protein